MARIFALALAVTVSLGALQAMAADTVTCSLVKAIQCTPDGECGELTMRDAALPRFVRIDLKEKTITSLDKEVQRTSKVSSVERLDGLIILHGTEVRGWSMVIGVESGDFTWTAAGESEGIVVFGSCIAP